MTGRERRPGQSSGHGRGQAPARPRSRPQGSKRVEHPADDAAHEPGIESRRAAGILLNEALKGRAGLDQALTFKDVAALSPVDRAFARAVAMAALRRLGEIDQILAARLNKSPPEAVMTLLRIALAQTLELGTPAFAAVSSAVKLAERDTTTRPYKGLINAVLRGIDRDGPGVTQPVANLPDWIAARWRATWGDAALDAIAEAARSEPPTDLTLKPDVAAETLATALEGQVLHAGPDGATVRTRQRGDLAQWSGFEAGDWWVQDLAAALPVRLLAPQAGERVADLCAAPGGKTLQLAALGAEVVAVDRSASRLKRLAANLERTGLQAEIVALPAEDWDDPRAFDAVLLDAPCSATGTLRRNPEVLRMTRPADIAKLADVQHRLLDAAAARVRPGGRLVYCTCSLEREEGETQMFAFLKRHPAFQTYRADPAAIGAPAEALTPEGWLRVLPSMLADEGGVDGFFIARLDRVA